MKPTKAEEMQQLQALVTGIPKYFPNFAFLVASQTLTTAEVMTMLNIVLTSVTAVHTARSAVTTAVIADDKVQAQYADVLKEVRQIIGVAYSNAPAILAELGMTPRKARAPLSVQAKAAADAKSKATRAARGTKGKKQKAAITGGVTGVAITPTTPAAPATTAPAAAPPAANGTTPHA